MTVEFRLPPDVDVPQIVRALRRRGPVVALDSTLPSPEHGGRSIVAGAPTAIWTWDRGRETLQRANDRHGPSGQAARSPFHALERAATAFGREGAFGFFSYECDAPPEIARLEPFPDGWFLLTDTVVSRSELGREWTIRSSDADLVRRLEWEIGRQVDGTREPAAPARGPRSTGSSRDLSLDAYTAAFTRARAALERGDSYQLCYTYPIERPFAADPLELFVHLRRSNPAPFAAYVEAPFGAIVSCSPERFLSVDGEGRVEARPMKGTAPRPDDPSQRERSAAALVASEKDRAENLMIADLLRNDLGRVCRIGSVRVTQPARLEEHASVFQLVSVVEGRLAPGRSPADLLMSAFPPGSMTGAPKQRSIELLRELESGPRGPYSGVLGHWSPDGRVDLSVVIRSVVVSGGRARVGVGSGIVWDSSAESEFLETRTKAGPLLAALDACIAPRGHER